MNIRGNKLFEYRRCIDVTVLAVFFGLSLTSFSYAASRIDFDIQPRALRVGEVAVCSITVRGVDNPSQPGLPPMDGWQITMAGTERSFSYGTGVGRDSAITFRFRLVPLKAGKFTFGPYQYAMGSETTELAPIEVEVVPPGEQAKSAAPVDMLFASLTSSTTNLYNQQVFEITLQVYAAQGVNLGRDISLLNMPTAGISFNQFQELGSSREVVNNNLYEVRRFRAKATALTAGSFQFEPTVRVSLVVPRQQRQRDPFSDRFGMFDDFFGRHETQPVDITPHPLNIMVHPLPTEGQPPGFAGAVGKFSFNAQVKPSEVTTGDPITINMQIAGEGNIESITAPEIVAANEHRIYEPRLVSRDVDSTRASGRIMFEQVLIPRSADVTHIPAISFSFFDPEAASYRVLKQGPFPLKVSPATGAVTHIVQAQAQQLELQTQILGADIVYLKPAPRRWRNGQDSAWYLSTPFLLLQLFPPFALGFLFALVRRRTELEQNVAKARRHRAPRSARAGLRRAESALAEKNARMFYESLSESMASYFGNRLNLSPGEVTSDTVITALRRGGLEEHDCTCLQELFRRCEEARFAGSKILADDIEYLREIINELNDLLKKCEKVRV